MAAIFNEIHPERNIGYKCIGKLVANFGETGSVCNSKRDGSRLLNEAAQIES